MTSYMKVKEAAERWRCSEATVYRGVANGAIETLRLAPNGRILINIDATERALAEVAK